jgi:hypothetical protein
MMAASVDGIASTHAGALAASAPAARVAAPAPAAPPAVQTAVHGRSLSESPDHAAAEAPANGHTPSPAPDIDALARQVYDVLKRRLAAERRRGA